jgi:hypothetical protein
LGALESGRVPVRPCQYPDVRSPSEHQWSTEVLIIGGSDAGIEAGLRATACGGEVTLLVAGHAGCGAGSGETGHSPGSTAQVVVEATAGDASSALCMSLGWPVVRHVQGQDGGVIGDMALAVVEYGVLDGGGDVDGVGGAGGGK